MPEIDFFDQLCAPLEPIAARVAPKASKPTRSAKAEKVADPPAEQAKAQPEPVIELEPGHYLNEFDSQVSFFEKKMGGIADIESLNAVMGEPYHVMFGQTYLLCKIHHLVINNIVDPPHKWKELLIDNRVFIPWPDLMAADLYNHTSYPVVMVQPDRYIAGLILNYYIARHGAESIELL